MAIPAEDSDSIMYKNGLLYGKAYYGSGWSDSAFSQGVITSLSGNIMNFANLQSNQYNSNSFFPNPNLGVINGDATQGYVKYFSYKKIKNYYNYIVNLKY